MNCQMPYAVSVEGVLGVLFSDHQIAAVHGSVQAPSTSARSAVDSSFLFGGQMKEIPLTQGYVAVVDDEDYERVMQHKWHATVAKSTGRHTVYARASLGHTGSTSLHRFVLNAPKGMQVDHKDHDGLNCRRDNLRLATIGQNRANTQPSSRNTSGHTGVMLDKRGKWAARIRPGGKQYRLGTFVNKSDADAAYKEAAKKYYGEFAYVPETDGEEASGSKRVTRYELDVLQRIERGEDLMGDIPLAVRAALFRLESYGCAVKRERWYVTPLGCEVMASSSEARAALGRAE